MAATGRLTRCSFRALLKVRMQFTGDMDQEHSPQGLARLCSSGDTTPGR